MTLLPPRPWPLKWMMVGLLDDVLADTACFKPQLPELPVDVIFFTTPLTKLSGDATSARMLMVLALLAAAAHSSAISRSTSSVCLGWNWPVGYSAWCGGARFIALQRKTFQNTVKTAFSERITRYASPIKSKATAKHQQALPSPRTS